MNTLRRWERVHTHCSPLVLQLLPLLHRLRQWRSATRLRELQAGLYLWVLVVEVGET
jgi:hypothetical protein